MRTDKQVVDDANALAGRFYTLVFGYERVTLGINFKRSTFRFDKSKNPKEQEMWRLAAIAYDFIEGTDVDDAITCLQEET